VVVRRRFEPSHSSQTKPIAGSNTATFVASSATLKSLQAEFNLKAEPEAEGLQLVKATPKQADGALQSLRVGLKPVANSTTPPVLSVLEIVDGFRANLSLEFQNFEVNPLPSTRFNSKRLQVRR